MIPKILRRWQPPLRSARGRSVRIWEFLRGGTSKAASQERRPIPLRVARNASLGEQPWAKSQAPPRWLPFAKGSSETSAALPATRPVEEERDKARQGSKKVTNEQERLGRNRLRFDG